MNVNLLQDNYIKTVIVVVNKYSVNKYAFRARLEFLFNTINNNFVMKILTLKRKSLLFFRYFKPRFRPIIPAL